MKLPKAHAQDKQYIRLFNLTDESWSKLSVATRHKLWYQGLSYESDNPLLKLNIDERELKDEYNTYSRGLRGGKNRDVEAEYKKQLDDLEEDRQKIEEERDELEKENKDLARKNSKMERELEHMKQRMTRKESETRDEFDRLKTRISTLEIQLATANKENQEFREQTTRELTDLRDEFFNKIYHELPNKVCENFTVKIRDEISLALETCNFSRKLDLLMNRMAS